MTKGMKHVVTVSSNVIEACPLCAEPPFNFSTPASDSVAERINHFLGHGYKLLHVGQQTETGPDGDPWQTTVAVLAK